MIDFEDDYQANEDYGLSYDEAYEYLENFVVEACEDAGKKDCFDMPFDHFYRSMYHEKMEMFRQSIETGGRTDNIGNNQGFWRVG